MLTNDQIAVILKNAPKSAVVWTDDGKYHDKFLGIESKAKRYQLHILKTAR